MFSWTGDMINGRYAFAGFQKSQIFGDDVEQKWRLELYQNKSVYAVSMNNEYPFGIGQWSIVNDDCAEPNKTLNLNGCHRFKEFNCDDGTCVMMNQRCDGKTDCPDKSILTS